MVSVRYLIFVFLRMTIFKAPKPPVPLLFKREKKDKNQHLFLHTCYTLITKISMIFKNYSKLTLLMSSYIFVLGGGASTKLSAASSQVRGG